MAAGTIPDAMIDDTAWPASSVDGKVAKKVRVACGFRRNAEDDLGDDAERALGAHDDAGEVVAGRVPRGAPDVDHRAGREHHAETEHVIGGEAVLEAVRAARVLGHVAADGAHRLRRRIGRVIVAGGADGAADVEVDDARLDANEAVLEIDLEDSLHPRGRDDDASLDGQRAARKAGARPARHDGQPVFPGDLQYGGDLFGRPGQRDEPRGDPEAHERIALVRTELRGVHDAVSRTDDSANAGGDIGERHGSLWELRRIAPAITREARKLPA